MDKICFFCVWLCICWTIIYATGPAKMGCIEREKALTLLETAEDILSKAKDAFPSCNEDLNSTSQSECGEKRKPFAYIEVSQKLISDVRRNFPICPKAIGQIESPGNCSEILNSGQKESGLYTIWLREPFTTGKPLQVFCDMKTDGGSWTVIQRRGKFSPQLDFNKDWESYKYGFGNLKEEFWLGNEHIRVLCQEKCTIRFDLQLQNGTRYFAVYKNFYLTGSNYQVNTDNYTGNAGNSMEPHNQYVFSTKDKDTSGKAKEYQSGWWHGPRYHCNLNGVYKSGYSGPQYVYWYQLTRNYENLASVEMKVRPN